VAAVEAACGYNYEETDQEYETKMVGKDLNGHPIYKEVPGSRKVKIRHSKKNDNLLKFLIKNRLPQYFSDVQHIEIDKKSIEIKEITAGEIKKFAGKLIETVQEDKNAT